MITHHSSLEVFHEQLSYVLASYKPHGLKAEQFSNVFIGGLGGSGIGGKLAKTYFLDRFPVPVEVISDYHLPGFVNKNTLVILGSYSGNTEETLTMYEEAVNKGCTILVISAGGELSQRALSHGNPCYVIETGYQPRMALGYSFGFLLKVMAELVGEDVDADYQETIESLKNKDHLKEMAEGLVKKFQNVLGRRYTIICDQALEGVAWRFAQQLNENSKVEAFVSVLPEANHNVIESYYGQLPANFIVLNSNTNERVGARFDFVSSLLERENNKLAVIEIEGISIPALFNLIYTLDWFTILITEPLGVDPMQIPNIISLKEYLTEV